MESLIGLTIREVAQAASKYARLARVAAEGRPDEDACLAEAASELERTGLERLEALPAHDRSPGRTQNIGRVAAAWIIRLALQGDFSKAREKATWLVVPDGESAE